MSQKTHKYSSECCLHQVHVWVPVVALLVVVGLFVSIIVISNVDRNLRALPWRDTTVIGKPFRIQGHKVVLPIIRRCDGPEVEMQFYTSDDSVIAGAKEVQIGCGSLLDNWLNGYPYELSVQFLSTSTKKIRAIVMHTDFVDLPVIDRLEPNHPFEPESQFTICVLPKLKSDPADTEGVETQKIPQVAAFIEAWLYYGATQFYVYDMDTRKNGSADFNFNIYSKSSIKWPFLSDKTVLLNKFPNANLYYAFDCLYRSRFTSRWSVLASFEDIPIVQTQASLVDALAMVSGSTDEISAAFQLVNGRTSEPSALIFDPEHLEYFGFGLHPIFKENKGVILNVSPELVKTFNILQLGAELFQQPNNSAMNEVFRNWINSFNGRFGDFVSR